MMERRRAVSERIRLTEYPLRRLPREVLLDGHLESPGFSRISHHNSRNPAPEFLRLLPARQPHTPPMKNGAPGP